MKTPTHVRLAAAAVTAALALTLTACSDPDTTSTTSASSSPAGSSDSTGSRDVAPDDTPPPPWPAPVHDVPARVVAAGLDLGPMGTAEHYHPTLTITIDGQPVPVAANVGVDPNTGAMSAVHTHEGDGTIHI